jgi:hypothetical protein
MRPAAYACVDLVREWSLSRHYLTESDLLSALTRFHHGSPMSARKSSIACET